MLEESAQLRMEARGEAQALQMQRYFMDAYQYGRGAASQVLFIREQAEKRFLDAFDLREDLSRQIRSSLEANRSLLGVYAVFEPNALDGKDELFIDQESLGSNDKGRFSIYWSQDANGELSAEAMKEESLNDSTPGIKEPLQRLVHLPTRKQAGMPARPLYRRYRWRGSTNDQHRVSVDPERQSDRCSGGGYQPGQPARTQHQRAQKSV